MNATLTAEIRVWLRTENIDPVKFTAILSHIFEHLDKDSGGKLTQTLRELWGSLGL